MIRSLLSRPLDTLREAWLAWRFYQENEVIRADPYSLTERSPVRIEGSRQEPPQRIDQVQEDPPECEPYLGQQCASRQYLFSVEEAALHGGLPFPIDSEGRVLWEMLAPRTELPPNHISIQGLRSQNEQLPVKSFDRPVVAPYTKHRPNYFHWLFDGIGRLQLLEKAGYDLSEFCYVLRAPLTAWQRDTLRGIGVPLDKCHTFEWFDFRVDRMVVLPCPWNRRRYSVSNMNWMRERFRGAFCDPEFEARPANQKIFIKRRDSEGRSILNRPELMPLIKEAGFEDVYLGDLTFPQQVRLFSQADTILGAHGAGLANMVFSDDAHIVEIFFGERPMFYWLMARSRGFEYQWIDATVGEGERGEQRPNGTLDRSELRTVLSKAL